MTALAPFRLCSFKTMTPLRLHTPGDVIGSRYRIVTLLGKGGMSETYEAEDLTTHQRIALKVLSLRQMMDWKMLDLFEREAEILAQLDHPNIPNYIDSFHLDLDGVSGQTDTNAAQNNPQREPSPAPGQGSVEGGDRQFYLIRELVPGESLADRLAKGWRPKESDLRDVASQVLNILVYLHSLSPPLIHRDIKPANIIRQPDGTLFLVDFATVQAIYRETFLGSNTFVGTAGYMPPEQFRGQAIAPSDLYSLGATLIFLATQQTPDQLPQTRMKVNVADCTSFSPQFTIWLSKLLEPIPEDRFQTATEALDLLLLSADQWPGKNGEPGVSANDDSIFTSSSADDSMVVMPQPTGSRSTVERSYDRLRITIPLKEEATAFFQNIGQSITGTWSLITQQIRASRARLSNQTRSSSNHMALRFIGLLLSPLILLITVNVGIVLFFMLLSFWPLWILGLIIFFLIRHDRCDTMVLDITEQEFYLRHVKRGQTQKAYRGNSQILYASLGPDQGQGTQKYSRMACVLTEHTQRRYTVHYIGQHLMPSEQEWLVDEMSLFLKTIKLRDS